MPRTLDLALFVATTTDTTDYSTPAAHACTGIIKREGEYPTPLYPSVAVAHRYDLYTNIHV